MRETSPRSVDGPPHSIAGTVDNDPGSIEGRHVDPLSAQSMFSSILFGGFIAGTVDIASACLINGTKPSVILQAIAGGLLGKSTFNGGATTAALGLGLQWAMSIIIASIFVVAGRWKPALRRRWVEAGLAYGVVVFAVMNYIVLPLSAVGHVPHFRVVKLIEDMLAMLLFGLIVAFCARARQTSVIGTRSTS